MLPSMREPAAMSRRAASLCLKSIVRSSADIETGHPTLFDTKQRSNMSTIHLHTCIYVCIHTYIYISIPAHTHTHTYKCAYLCRLGNSRTSMCPHARSCRVFAVPCTPPCPSYGGGIIVESLVAHAASHGRIAAAPLLLPFGRPAWSTDSFRIVTHALGRWACRNGKARKLLRSCMYMYIYIYICITYQPVALFAATALRTAVFRGPRRDRPNWPT